MGKSKNSAGGNELMKRFIVMIKKPTEHCIRLRTTVGWVIAFLFVKPTNASLPQNTI